ncbi:hypothetical protein GQ42DRAFT_178029 [Ramicandelaber brevisporus]|nr:hypothetical protein GQ42DRAFT_178029 [Ramicandelaber brevisporus]
MVSPLVSGSTTAHFGHAGNGAPTPLSPHLHQPQPSPSTGVTTIIVPSSMQLISPTSTTTPTLSKKQAAAMREANIGYMQLIAPNNPSNSIVLVGNHYSRADVTAAINDTPEPCVLRLRELSEKACDDSILAALHGNAGIREVHIERCLGITFFGVVALLRSLRPRVAALTYIAHPASSPPENSMINALLGSLSKKNTLRLYLDFPRGNYAHYYMTIVTEFVNLQALGYHFRTPVRFAPSLSATSVSVVSSSTGASSETASTTSASDQQRSAPGRSLIWLSIILPANLGTVAGQTMSSLRTLIVYGVNEDDDIGAMRGEEITRLFKARTPGARVGSGNDSPPWHANLRNLLLVQCASIQESVLTEISGSCPQIERIVVDGCKHATTAGGMNLLRDLTKLTHLSIAGSTSIGSKTLLKRPVSTLAGLQYLHIQYTQFYMEQANTVFFNMPQLRTLYFDNSDFSATVSRHLATPQSSSTNTIERMCTLQNRTDVVLDVDTSMADPLLTHPMLERFFDGISVADLVAQAGLQLYVDIDDPSDVAFEDDSSMDVVITPIVPPARRNRPKVSPLHNVVDSSSQDGFGGSALVSPSLSNGISPSATISPITQQMSRTSLISGTVDSAVSMVSNSHSDTMVSTAQLSPLPHVSATLATNRYRSNSDVNAGKRALRHRGSIQNAGQSRLGLVSDIAPPPLRGSSDELQYSSSISHSAATSPALLAEPPHSPRSPYSQHHQPPLSSPHRLQHRSSVHQFPLPYQRPSTSSTSMSAGRRHSRVQSSISNSYNDHARFQDTSEFMAPVHSDQRQPGPQAVPPTQQVGYSYGSVEDVRMAGDSNDIIEPSWLPSPVGQRYIRPPGQLPQPPPLHQRPVLPQPPQSQPQPQPQPQLHASASTSPPVYFDGTPYSPHATAAAPGSSYTHQQVSRQTSQTPLYQSYQSQLQPPQNYAQSGPLSSPQTVTRIRLPPPTPTTPLHYTSQSN